jgi:iron complex outermembrane receptor protein
VILEPGIRTYINTDQAAIWGYEVMLQWQLPAGLSHRLQYQYQRGTSDTDQWLSDLNPPSWRYGVQWLSPEFEFKTELVYRPSRESAGPGEQALDSATWLDSQLRFNWLKHAKLTFFINNVFDEAYRGSADEQAPFQPGRTFGLGIEWTPS